MPGWHPIKNALSLSHLDTGSSPTTLIFILSNTGWSGKQPAKKDLVSGRGPTGVAAAAIYVASTLSDERKTQREVAEVAGVTEVTIRNRYKELIEELGMEDKMQEAL